MSSKAITEEKTLPDAPPPSDGQPVTNVRETAPSVMAAEEPTLARTIGFIGLLFFFLGTAALLFNYFGRATLLPVGLAGMCVLFGLGALLFHAARETEIQYRRTYGAAACLWLLIGLISTGATLAGSTQAITRFLPIGYSCFLLALLFLLPFVKNETDEGLRRPALYLMGVLGTLFAVVAFLWGSLDIPFLLNYSLLLGILGLAYLWAFVVQLGTAEDAAYKMGLGMGVLGLVGALVGIGRSFLPFVFSSLGWMGKPAIPDYFESAGILLLLLGLSYTAVAAGLCSDSRFVVLTRRELAAFFFSPLAYVIMFCFAVLYAWRFAEFVNEFFESGAAAARLEPIVFPYTFNLFPVFALILVVPLLTMRLFSEEKRSATMEVLLTAPVTDTPIVLSKFISVLVFFMLIWLPYGLFLLALRIESGQVFDYRPLISFSLAQAASGAAFLSMGLFFSSLTRNQVAAGVMTAIGMVLMVGIFFARSLLASKGGEGSPLVNILGYFSFIDLWRTTLNGRLFLHDLFGQVSLAVFWLYLTVQILESRRWK